MPKLAERTDDQSEGGLLTPSEAPGKSQGRPLSPEENDRFHEQVSGFHDSPRVSPTDHSSHADGAAGGAKKPGGSLPTDKASLGGAAAKKAADKVPIPEKKEQGKAADAVDKAAGEATKVGVETGLAATGVGTAVAKPAGEIAGATVEKVGVKRLGRNALIGAVVVLSPLILLLMIAAYVVTHPWEAAKKVLFDSSYRRFGLKIAEQTGGAAIKAAFSALSYETDYKPGQAIAAPSGTRPEPGTLLDKISKVDFAKSQYQYKGVDCPYEVVTKRVVAFDGKTRSVIDKVVDKKGNTADSSQPEVMSCVFAHYPLVEAMARSPEVRKVNQAANVHLTYAEPKGSATLKDKSQTEVKEALHKKTLERVWSTTDGKVECDKNFKQSPTIDSAIDKIKNDLRCGVKPEDVKLGYTFPSDKYVYDTSNPTRRAAAVKALAKTVCKFNDQLLQDASYTKNQVQRYDASARAGSEALTLADTGLGGDISTSELNGDFYKISNFASSRAYNYAVNGTSSGTQLSPEALAARVIGIVRADAQKADEGGTFTLDEVCTTWQKGDSNTLNQEALNVINVYTILKARIYNSNLNVFEKLYTNQKSFMDTYDTTNVLLSTFKIVANASNTGTEDGPDNFGRMMLGAKNAAYNQLLGASGGHYETAEEAAKSSAMVEGIKRFNEQHNGIAYRLFGRDNVRSLASQLTSQFTARPDQVGQKAIAAAIDVVNPIKAGARINDAIAYYGFGENNHAIAASDDDRDYYRLTTAGTDSDIDMLSNASYIEGLKKSNNPSAVKAFAKWDQCSQMYWASAELLDNDPNAYSPNNSATKDSTERACQIIRRSPASVNIPENFAGEKQLAKRYANYIGNMNLFTAWDKLSSDAQDDTIYANGASGSSTGTTPTPGPTIDGLTYPPNLAGAINGTGYYRMPDAQPAGLYVFSGGTPDNSRCGSKELTAVIYTVAQQWKKTYPDSTLVVGDLNAPGGHLSHKKGVDVDITTSDRSAANTAGDAARSIQLGKWFIDTGIVKLIYYNDTAVQQAVTAYARQVNKPGEMKYWSGHENHFHVRILDTYLQPVSMGCPS